MQVDPDDTVLAPDRILEPVEVPQALPHLFWRRAEADAVSGALVRQQIAWAVLRHTEESARAGFVIDGSIAVAGDEQQRGGDCAKPFLAPGLQRAACGGNRDDRLDVGDTHGIALFAASRIRQQEAAWHHLHERAPGVQFGTCRSQHSIAAHGIADQRRSCRIDAAALGQGALHRFGDERDVEWPAKQELGKLAAVGDRRIIVPDCRHDIALRGEILAQPTHRNVRVTVAVRHDHKRKSSPDHLGVAHRDSGNRESRRRRGRLSRETS